MSIQRLKNTPNLIEAAQNLAREYFDQVRENDPALYQKMLDQANEERELIRPAMEAELSALKAQLRVELRRRYRVYRVADRIAHPHAIHGTPITPKRQLQKLKGASFCVSYFHPEQLEDVIQLLAEDSMLLLDCGAFSAWTQGLVLGEDYWTGYWAWALEVIERVPQAVAVIPDVIGGSEEENLAHVTDALFRHDFARERLIPVWHLHESLDQLGDFLDMRFGTIAFGSSGIYKTPGTAPWRERTREAFEYIERRVIEDGCQRPRIHMMRGLGQMKAREFPFSSADSTNVARNWARSSKRGVEIEAFRDRIEADQFPDPPGLVWPYHHVEEGPALTRGQSFPPTQTSLF